MKTDNKFDNAVVLQSTGDFEKLREAVKFVYTNYFNDFDWLFKSNDDCFVVLENLRHMLYQYNTEWPIVIGQRFLQEV